MNWILIGAIFSGLSVMLGAMGAHSLKNILSEKNLSAFQTATEYMGYHGIALILVGIICFQLSESGAKALKKVGILFTAGTVMFSGSIYILISLCSQGVMALLVCANPENIRSGITDHNNISFCLSITY